MHPGARSHLARDAAELYGAAGPPALSP